MARRGSEGVTWRVGKAFLVRAGYKLPAGSLLAPEAENALSRSLSLFPSLDVDDVLLTCF